MAVLSGASLSGQALKAGANKRRRPISSQFHCLCPPWLVYAPDQNRRATQAKRKRDSASCGRRVFFSKTEKTLRFPKYPDTCRQGLKRFTRKDKCPSRIPYEKYWDDRRGLAYRLVGLKTLVSFGLFRIERIHFTDPYRYRLI